MIMRYQRVSPDGAPSSSNNGRRIGSSSWRTCREDEDNGGEINGTATANGNPRMPSFEGKGLSRFRSPSMNHQDHISSPPFGSGDSNGCAGGGGGSGGVSSSPPPTEKNHHHHHQEESTPTMSLSNEKSSPSRKVVGVGAGGDGLLQWGHRKRSRCSRSESARTGAMVGVTNDHESSSISSSSSSVQLLQGKQPAVKASRRSMVDKLSTITKTMPPPPAPSFPPPTTSNGIAKGPCLKSCIKDNSSASSPNRRNNLEERSGAANASPTSNGVGNGRSASSRSKVGKRSPSLAEKFGRKNPSSSGSGPGKEEKMNGGCSSVQRREALNIDSTPQQSEQPAASNINDDDNSNTIKIAGGRGGEKANGCNDGGEANEWPRIYIPLSRKEKEEDFLAMKGTKLPHRPKKRPKNIDRILQYCFPGMWLSDLTRGRYEVREKKCTKKQKRRGLKGMESMDSDSE